MILTKPFMAALSLSLALGACASVDSRRDTDAGQFASPAETIRADVAWLADDAREGREAGTRAYLEAAEYVAARMKAIGLEPAGDDGWYQEVPLRAATPVLEAAVLSITNKDGETEKLTHLDDFRVFPSIDASAFAVSAPAVFVGFGIFAPEAGHDDYAGLDVTGKIVVYFGGAPDSFESEQRAHYGSGSLKASEAAARGAVGTITLQTSASVKRRPWARFIANPKAVSMRWVGPDGRVNISGPGIKGRAVLNPAVSAKLFEGADKSYADVLAEADANGGAPKGFDLPVTVSMKGAVDLKDLKSPNVAGLIRGADPVLRNEYVVLTAHLDHIGVNQTLVAEGKDGINNGAMDNALGVATMLAVARRLKRGAPLARSVIILAVTGEEKGLLGAGYFAHFPTVPKDAIVANVNLDMPVMLHSFTDVVAFGAEHSTLGPITRAALEKAGVALSPDPFPEQGIFTRSDHYRFVQQGVPAVYLFPGFANGGEEKFNEFLENHYHKPSDDVSLPIRYDDVARFAELNYFIARDIANAPVRPRWNEGDFFGDLFAGE